MRPRLPLMHAAMPVLQSIPACVSPSAPSQIRASSLPMPCFSTSRMSGGTAFQAVSLAPKIDSPQPIDIACMWLVTSKRPISLPLSVPVMAQSTAPRLMAGMISAKAVTTGIAPRALIISDWPTEEVRMRRPFRSSSPVKGCRQKSTCAG